MNTNQQENGQQHERTSLSWLRTFLVMFILCILLLKMSNQYSFILLTLNATILFLFLIYLWFYRKYRFITYLHSAPAVTNKELTIKKYLSLLVFITALIYGSFSIYKYFLLINTM